MFVLFGGFRHSYIVYFLMEYVPVAKTGYPGYHLPGLAAPPGFLARVEDLRSHQQPSPQLGEQIWAEVHSSFLEEVL
jgi:hypothetical protein